MSDYENILFEHDGPIARITLNRPNAANGIDQALADELVRAAQYCSDDPAVKVVVLTGAGRFFSAGGDVRAMAASADTGEFIERLADTLHRAVSALARMDALLIVGVNGTAAGAGMSLAVAGDLVVAAESASFTMAYTKVGLSPDGGASYYLPRLIGVRKTQELMLTNRTLSAAEALDWGLLHRVVRDVELADAVETLAQEFATGPKASNANVKKLLLVSSQHNLEEQLNLEASFITRCSSSPDGQEGIAAFVGKRAPKFA
ncbi:enoyl-CoA hydratase/isomerase family protein [Nocardia seriolae]|uniref:2-(1,2-epoxy-1,2-dihydrophenyl)acetyl-CoA isomerase n=1 Tax=Nocardia seriolae TaxID=37332 RepID=A0A0B8N6S2_9NOCA|nr:enoyl-CoA hydratase-related protein [Nocardia seriolae]APA94638.1 2-(1,2-epoxy-1,2-dihydrophenyl)acetyl-CoA isomerase [Nocardia seriolae]MTJ66959.1 enoyl-CoA hydratase [Nocardia seriolae]MTJ72784.1 enoyl-CoA hydratase [Nocardia seriolae]MTJ84940.1 enoyl-CoA hydratase [Nocardia seriolae]MTK28936.1 enoyl-CoA hydratase [Nocardia seriolae]